MTAHTHTAVKHLLLIFFRPRPHAVSFVLKTIARPFHGCNLLFLLCHHVFFHSDSQVDLSASLLKPAFHRGGEDDDGSGLLVRHVAFLSKTGIEQSVGELAAKLGCADDSCKE